MSGAVYVFLVVTCLLFATAGWLGGIGYESRRIKRGGELRK